MCVTSALVYGSSALVHGSSALVHGSSALVYDSSALVHDSSSLVYGSSSLVHGSSALVCDMFNKVSKLSTNFYAFHLTLRKPVEHFHFSWDVHRNCFLYTITTNTSPIRELFSTYSLFCLFTFLVASAYHFEFINFASSFYEAC